VHPKNSSKHRKRQRIGIPFTGGPLQLLSGQRPGRSQLLGIKITHHRQTLRQWHHGAPNHSEWRPVTRSLTTGPVPGRARLTRHQTTRAGPTVGRRLPAGLSLIRVLTSPRAELIDQPAKPPRRQSGPGRTAARAPRRPPPLRSPRNPPWSAPPARRGCPAPSAEHLHLTRTPAGAAGPVPQHC